jgi:TolB-like protein/DNA-binding winged helix-turn-helix (wHTH) protein/Tfp pilus assembly protein PilF
VAEAVYSPRLVRFGIFEVDLQVVELRKGGLKLKLTGQPFQVLAILLERPNEVVTREELQKRLWPDTFVDVDHNLNTAINKIRDALGDSAENPRFVETLARRGYRFIAPVDTQITQPVARPRASRLTRTLEAIRPAYLLGLAGIAAVILAAVVGLTGAGSYRTRLGFGGKRIESLAVLPLENLSRDPDQEYFSDGMTDALIADLSKIGALRVTSSTSSMRYKKTGKSLPEIARELNVDGVVEGSVVRSGNRVRITARLIQAPTDQDLWAETYERDLGDVLKLQSDVAQAVAQQVRAQLTPEQQARLRSAPVVNPKAYEAYLKGRFYEAAGTQVAIKQAQDYFTEAIRGDPKFALAYVGLADCYLDLGAYRWLPPQEAYRQGSEAVHKALQLDETLGEAHSTLGYLNWQYSWDWQTAERELRHAVDLNPQYIEGHEALGWYLAWSGRRDEALAEVEKMRWLDPAYRLAVIDELGVYYHQRDYKSLVEAGQKSVAANPELWASHYFLAVGYEGSGRQAQAIPEYQKAVELSQSDSDTTAGLAHVYATVGRKAEAEKIVSELQRQSKVTYVSPYMMAVIYAGLGQNNKAFEFLEKAYQERSPDIAYFLKADLRIDTLRSDPRFQDLLRRVGLPQ